jgi:hypothetical protein
MQFKARSNGAEVWAFRLPDEFDEDVIHNRINDLPVVHADLPYYITANGGMIIEGEHKNLAVAPGEWLIFYTTYGDPTNYFALPDEDFRFAFEPA